jgi:uncharacterized protein (DUF1330 family)
MPAKLSRQWVELPIVDGHNEAGAWEGEDRPRNFVIQFESYEAAQICFYSWDYEDIKAKRKTGVTEELVWVEGV